MDRLRLALVGCGNISRLNAPGYLQHPRCEVVVLCDALPERAKRRAAEWGISPRLYSDLAQVLDDPGTVQSTERTRPPSTRMVVPVM
jgi:predicted dehydrogenase